MSDDSLKSLRQLVRLQRVAFLRAVLSAFMILAASGGIATLARGAEAAEQELEEEADESLASCFSHGSTRSGGRQTLSFILPVSTISSASKIFGTSPFSPEGHFLTSELRAPLRC